MINEKKKLLIAADTYYPKVDGVLKFMEEFMKRTKDDFDLTLIAPQFSNEKKFNYVKTIFLELYHKLKLFTYEGIRFSFKNLKKIKEAVKNADIVFIQELGPVGFLSLHYAQKYKKKKVFYVHNTPWDFLGKYYSLNEFWSNLIKKFFVGLYNKGDLLLIPYQDLKKRLEEQGVHTEMKVTRLGVDIARFSPGQDKSDCKFKLFLPNKPLIGYVGRISNEKNTLILLDAFKKISRKDVYLLMVGDGQPELVKKFKETRNCLVTGFVDKVEDYLKAMDIFVMPSLTETTSLATLEAMAAGLPVISTKVGFMNNYIVKDHNGIFFPRNSSTMLAAKIESLLKDKNKREKLGQNARKTVSYSFTWEKSINKIKRLLKEG